MDLSKFRRTEEQFDSALLKAETSSSIATGLVEALSETNRKQIDLETTFKSPFVDINTPKIVATITLLNDTYKVELSEPETSIEFIRGEVDDIRNDLLYLPDSDGHSAVKFFCQLIRMQHSTLDLALRRCKPPSGAHYGRYDNNKLFEKHQLDKELMFFDEKKFNAAGALTEHFYKQFTLSVAMQIDRYRKIVNNLGQRRGIILTSYLKHLHNTGTNVTEALEAILINGYDPPEFSFKDVKF